MTYLGLAWAAIVLSGGLAVACGGSASGTGGDSSGGSAGLGSGLAGGGSSGHSQTSGGTGPGIGGQPPYGEPNGGAPNGGAPNGGASSSGAPNGGASSSGAPNGGTPSGGAPGGSCKPITACAGNLVGSWHTSQICSDNLTPKMSAACLGGTTQVSSVGVTGTITFNLDNTIQTDATTTFNESANFPTSCYTQAQCTQLQATLAMDPSVITANCAYGAATGCICTLSASAHAISTGTYQTSGSNLTITSSIQTVESDTYCVSGTTLMMQNVNATTGALSMLTLTR